MSRSIKIMVLAATVGAGFISGCSSSSCERPPLFWRFRSQNADCCPNGGATVTSDGPVLDGGAGSLPPARPAVLSPQPTSQPSCGGGPTPSAVPRLAPQPQTQSQPKPYVPQ